MTQTDQHIYVAIENVITEYVTPALGDEAENHDLHSIAIDITERHDEPHPDDPAWANADRAGYTLRYDIDFWEVVARHEIPEDAPDHEHLIKEAVDRLTEAEAALSDASAALTTRMREAQEDGEAMVHIARWAGMSRNSAYKRLK